MKTNQILIRTQGLNHPVRQQLKTRMLNANDVLKAFNKVSDTAKHMHNFIKGRPETNKFVEEICSDAGLSPKEVIKTSTGKNGGTWMHPYLFLDFCMWLSPEFKLWAIKAIHDRLVEFRHSSGDSFKEMSTALNDMCERNEVSMSGLDYAKEAKMVNQVALGVATVDRNVATEKDLNKLTQVQNANIKLLNKDTLSRLDRRIELEKFVDYL